MLFNKFLGPNSTVFMVVANYLALQRPNMNQIPLTLRRPAGEISLTGLSCYCEGDRVLPVLGPHSVTGWYEIPVCLYPILSALLLLDYIADCHGTALSSWTASGLAILGSAELRKSKLKITHMGHFVEICMDGYYHTPQKKKSVYFFFLPLNS